MATQTILMDFTLPQNCEPDTCEQVVKELLEDKLTAVGGEKIILKLEMKHTGDKVDTVIYSDNQDMLITIRINKTKNLLTINVDGLFLAPSGSEFKDNGLGNKAQLFEQQNDLLKFETTLSRELGVERSSTLPVIVRGIELSPYWTTTDDRIVECSIKGVVHEEVSKYQKIQILDTIDFGRTLVLDGQVNLSEADLIYTLTLLNDEEYGGADVLILGGGDGALLSQLLTLAPKPNHVTMVELDPAVMEAVARHMPSVTGGVLDNLSGSGYDTIVGDAVKYLEKCKSEGKLFNFIFGDLTDVPIDTDNDGKDVWDFISLILEMSFSCIKPGGKYLTHVTGKAAPKGVEMFTEKVKEAATKIGRPVDIKFSEVFVPSFMEVWIFSQIIVE